MATYGSRDSGNFSYSHLQNVRYYTKIDSVTGEITLKSTTVADPNVEGAFVPSGSESDDRQLGTIDPQTGVFTATEGSGTSADENTFFSSPEGIKSVKESVLKPLNYWEANINTTLSLLCKSILKKTSIFGKNG